ncbi:hypothetical protein MTO96_023762 [Rhipicephalus appendiculatus]
MRYTNDGRFCLELAHHFWPAAEAAKRSLTGQACRRFSTGLVKLQATTEKVEMMKGSPGQRCFFVDRDKWAWLVSRPKDSLFCKKATKLLWGVSALRNRSITGAPCRRFARTENQAPPRRALTPLKLEAVANAFNKYVCDKPNEVPGPDRIKKMNRTQLAVLHFTENASRHQAQDQNGQRRWKRRLSKSRKGHFTARKIMTAPTFAPSLSRLSSVAGGWIQPGLERTSFGARSATFSEATRPASAPVSLAGVQFLAALPTQSIEQAASRLYRPASPVLQPLFTYTSQPLVYNAVPQERFSPPRKTLPFVTTPGFPADPQYPQPQYGAPFSPSSPPQYALACTPQIHMTTMPDVSSSLPLFENCHKQSARLWIEEIQRTQQLASWSPETTRLIVASKLRGTAKNWHLTLGTQFPTWDTRRKAFLDAFADELTLFQWQQQVTSEVQSSSLSLRDYAYAKLRVIGKCPAPLTELQKVEYLLHGILCASTVTSIAAQRPSSVSSFIDICTQLDRAMQHRQATKEPRDRLRAASSWSQ